jgi:hypothetical protein
MSVINVDYDDKVVPENDINTLSVALQKIVTDVTHIGDLNVHANIR